MNWHLLHRSGSGPACLSYIYPTVDHTIIMNGHPCLTSWHKICNNAQLSKKKNKKKQAWQRICSHFNLLACCEAISFTPTSFKNRVLNALILWCYCCWQPVANPCENTDAWGGGLGGWHCYGQPVCDVPPTSTPSPRKTHNAVGLALLYAEHCAHWLKRW